MFCSNCGKEIDDKAVICIHCGCETHNKLKNDEKGEEKSALVALLLCLFLGGLGIHNFYVGKTGSGIAQLLCTLFCWLIIPGVVVVVWVFVDFIMIICGAFKDKNGKTMKF